MGLTLWEGRAPSALGGPRPVAALLNGRDGVRPSQMPSIPLIAESIAYRAKSVILHEKRKGTFSLQPLAYVVIEVM